MAPQSKNNDWTTTLRSTQSRRLKLEQLRQKRATQLKKPASEISLSDLLNEAIDRLVEYDNDLEGSKMALAYGVGEKIAEGQAVLATQLLALMGFMLEFGSYPAVKHGEVIRNKIEWSVAQYSKLEQMVIDKRKTFIRAERAENQLKREVELAQIEASRQQKSKDEARDAYLNNNPVGTIPPDTPE